MGQFQGRLTGFDGRGNESGALTLQMGMKILDAQRVKYIAASFLVGDGVMAVLDPKRVAEVWVDGPKPWRKMMRGLSKQPNLIRVIGVAEAAFGVWLALSEDES